MRVGNRLAGFDDDGIGLRDEDVVVCDRPQASVEIALDPLTFADNRGDFGGDFFVGLRLERIALFFKDGVLLIPVILDFEDLLIEFGRVFAFRTGDFFLKAG